MRRFEFQDGSSNKFWEIELQDDRFTVRWGKLGTNGQSQTKSFPSSARAQSEHDKLVAEKVAKGYREVGGAVATATQPPPRAASPAPGGGAGPDRMVWSEAARKKILPWPGMQSPAAPPEPAMKKVLSRLAEVRQIQNPAQPGTQATLDRWRDLTGTPSPDPKVEGRVGALMGLNDWSWPRAEEIGADLVHFWVSHRGVVYATEVLCESFALLRNQDGKLEPNSRTEYLTVGPWKTLRAYLAASPDYEAARQVAERYWPDAPLGLAAALALAFPTEREWVRSVLERGWAGGAHGMFHWAVYCVVASLFEANQLERFVASMEALPVEVGIWEYLPSAVDRVGPEAAPYLMRFLKLKEAKTDQRRLVAGALQAIRSPEVAAFMAAHLDHKVIGPFASEYLAAAPELAQDGLQGARGSAAAALSARMAEAPRVEVPAADRSALPRVLASPPWLEKTRPEKPLVVAGLEVLVEGETVHWKPGEREKHTFQTGLIPPVKDLVGHLSGQTHVDPEILFVPAHREQAVEAFNRLPYETWNRYRLGSEWSNYPARFLSYWGPGPLPGLLQALKAEPALYYRELARVESPRLAWLYAEAWARTKKLRKLGAQWLSSYPGAAALGLVPLAVGPTGKNRELAGQALRYLAARGQRDAVLEAAGRYGAEARVAMEQVLAYDTLREVPSRLPGKPAWLNLASLPRPVLKAGGSLPPEALEHLVTMLSFSPLDPAYPGLEQVKEACTPGSLEELAWQLFQGWLHAGANARESWAYLALGHFGGDRVARDLTPLLRRWPGEGFSARAAEGLEILGVIGSDIALMHLHGIAQKLRYKALQDKAREKIEQIAEARGLTVEELADRLVPDLDLEADGTRWLEFGPRRFKVGFDHELRPFVQDEAGKNVGELPKPLKSDDAARAAEATEAWKALKKDAKTIARQLILRLETAMAQRRRWDRATFETFLARHPLACHLVRRLVWGVYDAEGNLTASFRVAEDGSYTDCADRSYSIPEGAVIGVAHPLELASDLAVWRGLLDDYKILQPFPQVSRPVFKLEPGEAKGRVKSFDLTAPAGQVLGLEGRGWKRPDFLESGVLSELRWPTSEGEAVLTFHPGVYVADPSVNPTQSEFRVELAHGTFLGRLHPVEASELIHAVEVLRS